MSAKAAVDVPRIVILIAEDDPNDVLLLKRAFDKARLRARLFFVSNGLEAINYLQGEPPFNDRASHPYPDLLVLDLNMPGVGGLEVLEWLAARTERPGIRAVVFSSCLAPQTSRHAANLGAHACLTKPLDPLDLVPALKDLPGFTELDPLP